ncbi:MAG: DUF5343 domain-containing protein [Firmicutes bacterium]|nr:DUF5343 domain-containing protein [Bacillota bacterium]
MEYPYVHATQKLADFFENTMLNTGVPPRVTNEWLASLGYTSSNDRAIRRVLRFLGFVDENGVPTALWRQYRGGHYRQVLADAIRKAYGDLYTVYPQADRRTAEEFANFFRARSNGGSEVISKTVATFLTLCRLARSEEREASLATESMVASTVIPTEEGVETSQFSAQAQGIGEPSDSSSTSTKRMTVKEDGSRTHVEIHVEIRLPETADIAFFERFFAAMQKFLRSDAEKN